MNSDLLIEMVAAGYVSESRMGEYRLYNYTQKCQFERAWNAVTLACRGVVLREDGSYQSRPFGKFFNVEEHDGAWLPPLPDEPFSIHEKLDGSLVVASRESNGGLLVTTRGSFVSSQATAARSLLDGCWLPQGETWCFEFLAPWNRIVVDYGDREELVLLARIDNFTGSDIPLSGDETFRHATTLDDLSYEEVLCRMDALGPNEEGYVLRFASGVRAKAKGAEYKRLHRIVTGTNEKTVWEMLRDGRSLSEITDSVPDEFHNWLRLVESALRLKYDGVMTQVQEWYQRVVELPSRKEQAIALREFDLRSAVFLMLDGNDPSPVIWGEVKPNLWHLKTHLDTSVQRPQNIAVTRQPRAYPRPGYV